MAVLHIDTSNVTLMGEFKSAIEDYVQKYIQGYVDKVMVGRHSTLKNSSWDFSGDKNDTIRNISIPFDKSKEHCGVINIKLSDQTTNDPKSQIFFWYDGNKLNSLFNPLIHTNSYGSQEVQQVDLMGDTICIKVSNSGNPYALSYDSASFSVDYHIW